MAPATIPTASVHSLGVLTATPAVVLPVAMFRLRVRGSSSVPQVIIAQCSYGALVAKMKANSLIRIAMLEGGHDYRAALVVEMWIESRGVEFWCDDQEGFQVGMQAWAPLPETVPFVEVQVRWRSG